MTTRLCLKRALVVPGLDLVVCANHDKDIELLPTGSAGGGATFELV